MEMHSFMAVPPTVIHRVRNKSTEAPFVFPITQSPRTKYDFIAEKCVKVAPCETIWSVRHVLRELSSSRSSALDSVAKIQSAETRG